ncbi:histone-like nucleoid-structuring protein Lsr2 [Microlunatus flavus]|uniref:Lsr2 protein n=1 Tax=Microlunatus flavus TaxID=1036181 RepID=A0A1H8Z8G8_9ACTN|nr:Lsr2 family protein [Microlunatus flavus]SEP60696.1 Lsr2 protein [Microlunatus flavus]
MAQRVEYILEDDLDGGKADETVQFGLDGVEYEIDLSSANYEKLKDTLAPWVASARRTGGRRKRNAAGIVAPRAATNGSSNTSDIRAWAQENGYEVSSRGRVSAEVREAYDKAHA